MDGKTYRAVSWDLKEKGEQGEDWARTLPHIAEHFRATATS